MGIPNLNSTKYPAYPELFLCAVTRATNKNNYYVNKDTIKSQLLDVIIIGWQDLKDWFFTIVIVIGVLYMTYAAITSLFVGWIWDLVYLVLLLLYLGVYITVFVMGRSRFASKLQYQIAFILMTWVLIAVMLSAQWVAEGIFDQRDALKYALTPVAAILFFAPDESEFTNNPGTEENCRRSMPGAYSDSRQRVDSSSAIFEHSMPADKDINPYEYNPYRKKGQ